MLLIVSIIITAELYSTFKYHMKIGETTRCCSFFLRTHVKISSKISIIEFNIQIKWCIIVTPSREAEKDYQGYFNSPPHKKNHIATTMINTVLFKISPHIFTRRMTATCTNTTVSNIISTHILTKRMTVGPVYNSSPETISTHILTKKMTDQGGCLKRTVGISTHILTKRMSALLSGQRQTTIHFNSHPHEEDDQETLGMHKQFFISTHILTKRMTIMAIL